MSNVTASSLPEAGDILMPSLPQHWPSAAAALVVLILFLAQHLFKVDHLAKIPLVGSGSEAARREQYVSGKATDLYVEGYQKFKNSIFRIIASRPARTVVVSPMYLDELKKLPDTVLSFTQAVKETMQTEYLPVKIDEESHDIIHTIRAKLTPSLPRLNGIIADEMEDVMRKEFPATKEWSEVNIGGKILRTIAMVSGRVFIGPELCRDPTYLDSAINYPVDIIQAVVKVTALPNWLRPFRARSLPEVKRLEERMNEADTTLRPVVAARRRAEQDVDYQKPDDMLQWIMDVREKEGRRDDRELAYDQVNLSFSAIHTTAGPTIKAAYWLASMPEIVPMLREDVQNALNESNGAYTTLALQNMKKLDSFLKEVLRCSPTTLSAFERMVLQTFKLSTGETIPAGTVLEVPLSAIFADENIFPDPDKFDPLRYYRLRQEKANAASGTIAAEIVASAQFVAVSPSSLSFGFGRHACPGRFFAANQIKMLMANFLMNYDMKLSEGVKTDGTTKTDPSKSGAKILMRSVHL